jgi:DNA (cytosine-5)-methyltransferase 1
MCLNAGAMGRQDAESETLIPTGGCFDVAHTLRGDGFDASEDGTGRGTPLVPVAFDTYNQTVTGDVSQTLCSRGDTPGGNAHLVPAIAFAQNQRDEVRTMDVAGALAAEPGAKQQTYIAFSAKDHGADAGDIAPTLRSMGHDGSHANAGGQVAVAFAIQERAQHPELNAGPGGKGFREGIAYTLEARNKVQAVATGMAVRRLTPTECERLQGVPDDWTLVPNAKGKPMADGPRYKMIGNAFAEPCIRWIGMRIEAATRESLARARSEACA